jgi:prevent-host-death family protein
MVTVPARELKNRLGKYLQLVREGEPVRITDRGKPIGCIFPLADSGPHLRENQALARLLSGGIVRLGTGQMHRRPRPARMTPGKSGTEMLAEERR